MNADLPDEIAGNIHQAADYAGHVPTPDGVTRFAEPVEPIPVMVQPTRGPALLYVSADGYVTEIDRVDLRGLSRRDLGILRGLITATQNGLYKAEESLRRSDTHESYPWLYGKTGAAE